MTQSPMTAREALRAGAAEALAEVLRARHPDLAVDIIFGKIGSNGRARGDALDAEVRRLKAPGNDADSSLDIASAPAHPDDTESAA
jgi:hypothetical protein